MAKKLTPQKDDNQKLDVAELRKLLDSLSAEASKAKEHNAEAGNIIRGALETFGIDRTSFAMVKRVHNLADDRQQMTLRDFLKMGIALGWFSQRDAFEDVGDLLATTLGYTKPVKSNLRAVQ